MNNHKSLLQTQAPSARRRRVRPAGIGAVLLAGVLASPVQAQLADWAWEPRGSSLDMRQAANWVVLDTNLPPATPPGPQVRGRTSFLYPQAELSGLLTLGSLRLDTGLSLRGVAPEAALVLGNDLGVAGLMVGGEGAPNGQVAHFEAVSVLSAGSALVHGGSMLELRSQAAWSHQGPLVIGASAAAEPADSAWLQLGGGSSLGPGFGTLDVVVGSAGLGQLRVYSGASVLAESLVLGAGTALPQADHLDISGGRVEINGLLQVGRSNGGLLTIANWDSPPFPRGELVAGRVQVGERDGGLARVFVQAGGEARLGSLAVGTLAGSRGRVQTRAGSVLETGELSLGGGGQGWLRSEDRLVAGRVTLQAQGELDTTAATELRDLRMFGGSRWTTQGDTTVQGSVTVAEYGGDDVLMRVASGGRLHIVENLWAGDYHLQGEQPTQQRVVVEPGARLEVDGSFRLYATAELSGGGTVVTPELWVHGGRVAPGMSPGHLVIDGDLAFAGGELVIELGGLLPGSEHDLLEVLGTLTLDAWGNGTTLVLRAVDGFVPLPTQGFDFLRAAQIQGSFTSLVDETGLGLTLADLQMRDGHLGLNLAAAVPEPAPAVLLALGLAVLRIRRRCAVG